MNATEKQGLLYLMACGYQASEISFRHRRSPDFLTADGKGWEVKLIHGETITFYEGQIQELQSHLSCWVLFFLPNSASPVETVPFASLTIPGYWGIYRLTSVRIETGTCIRQIPDGTWGKLKALANLRGLKIGDYLTHLVLQEWERTTGGLKVEIEEGPEEEKEDDTG